jgi:hypothetical protein
MCSRGALKKIHNNNHGILGAYKNELEGYFWRFSNRKRNGKSG